MWNPPAQFATPSDPRSINDLRQQLVPDHIDPAMRGNDIDVTQGTSGTDLSWTVLPKVTADVLAKLGRPVTVDNGLSKAVPPHPQPNGEATGACVDTDDRATSHGSSMRPAIGCAGSI